VTEDEVMAEGCPVDPGYRDTTQDGSSPQMVKIGIAKWESPRAWHRRFWTAQHGPAAWERNDWVFVALCKIGGVE
jgi:hypothetical protein